MRKLLVSACLLGQPLRYDGDDNGHSVQHLRQWLDLWQQEKRLITVCPETLGGLPTPRPPAEAGEGGGRAVLAGESRVITYEGSDVTDAYIAGAEQSLAIAQRFQCRGALLASRSPSCGVSQIYDGSFTRTQTTGDGVTSALLQQHGIQCFTPEQSDALILWMNEA